MEENRSTFAILNAINCNDHTEKKGKSDLTYLSWAWAWQIAKTHFPDATYTIYENAEGLNYHHDGRTAWVKTGVTIGGIEHIEYLPVMDYNNASIPVARLTSFDVNKAIQRSLTKAIARHGLGLYIYAGEDLPDAADDKVRDQVNAEIDGKAKTRKKASKPAEPAPAEAASVNVDPQLLPGGSRFQKAVEQHAHGEMAGARAMRDIWINKVHATPEQVKAFDEAVFQFKVSNNLI